MYTGIIQLVYYDQFLALVWNIQTCRERLLEPGLVSSWSNKIYIYSLREVLISFGSLLNSLGGIDCSELSQSIL